MIRSHCDISAFFSFGFLSILFHKKLAIFFITRIRKLKKKTEMNFFQTIMYIWFVGVDFIFQKKKFFCQSKIEFRKIRTI